MADRQARTPTRGVIRKGVRGDERVQPGPREGDHQRKWKDGERRESRVVFIGRELPEQMIRDGFASCIVT